MEINNNYYDDLLEEPTAEELENQPEELEIDNEPLIPDQDDDEIVNDNEEPENQEDDLVTSYLKAYGIEDPSKIQFEGDNGEINEVDFNSLSKEEQLTMLQELGAPAYTNDEIATIQYLRNNNTTLKDVVEYFSQKAIEDYLQEHPEDRKQKSYKIDDYTDEELYVSDLKLRFPDLTDEELNDKLENAKLNEDVFNKEVAGLRSFYKAEEEKDEEAARQQEQQEYEQLQNALLTAASQLTEIKFDAEDPKDPDGFEIEDDDRNRALAYLLSLDKEGRSQFDRDLSDPRAIFELAYLRTSGRDLITQTSKYYKSLLAETRKELANAKKELEKYTKKNDNTEVVDTPPQRRKKDAKTMADLWG